MVMTVGNNPALVKGAGIFNDKIGDEMAKKIFINTGEFPYSIDGNPAMPGEVFETEGNVHINQLVGAGKAAEITEKNEKKYADALAKFGKKAKEAAAKKAEEEAAAKKAEEEEKKKAADKK